LPASVQIGGTKRPTVPPAISPSRWWTTRDKSGSGSRRTRSRRRRDE
jgi:hypothetical protein